MHRAKRSFFTNQENLFIRESVKRFGDNWEEIAQKIPGKTPKQIHDRYINYLRDGLKTEAWTKQEDEVLMNMYKIIGSKWTKMTIYLPGRSGNDIKNRWHKHLNKLNKQINDIDSDNEIEKNENHITKNSSISNNESINQITKIEDNKKLGNNDGFLDHLKINNNKLENSSLKSSNLYGNVSENEIEKNIKLINKINIDQNKTNQEKDIIDIVFNRSNKSDVSFDDVFDEIFEKNDSLWI